MENIERNFLEMAVINSGGKGIGLVLSSLCLTSFAATRVTSRCMGPCLPFGFTMAIDTSRCAGVNDEYGSSARVAIAGLHGVG